MQHSLPHTSRSGAAVVTLIVLFVAVIGISMAMVYVSTSRSSLKETTYNVEKTKAQSCADSAIDIASDCIDEQVKNKKDPLEACEQVEFIALDETAGSCNYKYSLEEETTPLFFKGLSKDHTEFITLNSTSTSIDIGWKTTFDGSKPGNILELDILREKESGGFDIEQVAYECYYSFENTGGSTKGFESASGSLGDEKHCMIAGGKDISGASYVFLTPRFNSASSIEISILGGDVPIQGYTIDAIGRAGIVESYVQVLSMLDNEASLFRIMNNAVYASVLASDSDE